MPAPPCCEKAKNPASFAEQIWGEKASKKKKPCRARRNFLNEASAPSLGQLSGGISFEYCCRLPRSRKQARLRRCQAAKPRLRYRRGGPRGCPRGVSPPAALPGGWSRGGRRQSESREGSRGESTWEIPWLVPQIDVFLALEDKKGGEKNKIRGENKDCTGSRGSAMLCPPRRLPVPLPERCRWL